MHITRRTIVAAAAAAVGVGTAPVALAGLAGGVSLAIGAEEVDPIFDAIEEHRKAYAAVRTFCARRVEDETDDDERLLGQFCDAEIDALWAFIDSPPTTTAGVGALLSYVAAHSERDRVWPERAGSADEPWAGEGGVTFHEDLIRAAATSLANISGRAAV
jgi:hypothetical protein